MYHVDAAERLSGDSTFPSSGIIVSVRVHRRKGEGKIARATEGRQWKAIKSVPGKPRENYEATRGSLPPGTFLLLYFLLRRVKIKPRKNAPAGSIPDKGLGRNRLPASIFLPRTFIPEISTRDDGVSSFPKATTTGRKSRDRSDDVSRSPRCEI